MIGIPGYVVQGRLGAGGFGTVYRAERTKDDQVCAIKVQTEIRSSLGVRLFANEIATMSHLSHPNIVSFIEVITHESKTHLVMEYCDGGDLRGLLDDYLEAGQGIFEEDVQSIFLQVLLGLHHCHSHLKQGSIVVHRDIKPENVLLTSGGIVKLADFGLSVTLKRRKAHATSIVGVRTMLPHISASLRLTVKDKRLRCAGGTEAVQEIHAGHPYGTAADMFSLGCLLYEMCTFDIPTVHTNDQGTMTIEGSIPAEFSRGMQDITCHLLNPELLTFPTTGEWLQDIFSISEAPR
ncbi:Serine/threonine-protein kinase Nek2 [Vanrija pseudolonga]|uniref:non-specific serine/threonine protein kinase n=1 Tax=Vanrija pseudolonga TaxID=143232 RepID=A0AAF0YL05_9TREE|nr:Serine/threonine-protein kinase Nek2 [Vanrija pseudolonga]